MSRDEIIAECKRLRLACGHDGNQSTGSINLALETCFVASDIPMFFIDVDGRFLRINTAGCVFLGYSHEDLLSMHFTDITDPEDIASSLDRFRNCIANKEPYSIKKRYRTKSGATKRVATTVTPVLDDDDTIISCVAQIHDFTEHDKITRDMHEQERFLEVLLDAIPTPVFYKDRHGRYLGFNHAFEEFFGENRDELIGKTVFETSPREFAEVYHAKDKALLEQGGIQAYEARVHNARGELREVFFHKAVFTGEDGEIAGLIGVVLDLTERKQAEEALRQSRKALLEAQTVAKIGSWRYDVEEDRPQWSQEMFRIFGIDPTECEPTWDVHKTLIHPEDWPEIDLAIRQAINNGIPYRRQFRIINPPGEPIWAETIGRTHRDQDGRIVELSGTVQDITERKATGDALASQVRTNRLILDSISDGFFSLDEDFIFRFYNSAAEAILQRPREDVIGRDFAEAFPEFTGSVFEEEYRKALVNREATDFETYFNVDPFTNWYAVHVYPFEEGISVFFHVITERKQLEVELEKRVRDRTNELNRMVQLMAGREVRMADLKATIETLKHRLTEAGIAIDGGYPRTGRGS